MNIEHLMPGPAMLSLLFDSLARSSLTKVVSVDLILHAVWKQEADRAARAGSERGKEHDEGLTSLNASFEETGGAKVFPGRL